MANVGNASLNDAQRKLVEDNMGLVYHQAHRMGISSPDLIQEGMFGLMNAARFYSPDFGAKFSTYAGSYIWAALHGTYSDKKNSKKQASTCSLDDPDLNIQPQDTGVDCGFFDYLTKNTKPIVDEVVRAVVEGFTKKEITNLLNLSTSELNSILNKVGRELYAERYTDKKN